MKNKKQRRIMFLLILLLGITVGFALLSVTLKINGTAGIKSNTWNIHWDDRSVNVTTGSVDATEPSVSTTTSTKDTVSFDVDLELPGDYFEFEVDAINEGSIDGAIQLDENYIVYKKDNVAINNLPNYLKFSVKYDDNTTPTDGDVLAHGTSKTYKIRVEYDSQSEYLPEDDEDYEIEITIPYIQHKDTGIAYNLGDLVYFDPVSEDTCNSSTFDLEKINNKQSTCYKWRVITTDDTTSKTNIKLQLDHNMAKGNVYTGSCGTASGTGPLVVLPALAAETENWVRIPLLNYEYDLGYVPDMDPPTTQKLVCENGACKVDRQLYNIPYSRTDIRVRMITGEEFMDIVKTVDPTVVWSFDSSQRSEDVFCFSTNRNHGQIQNQELKWLIENTLENSESGATNNAYGQSNSYYYWMLTPDYDVSLKGWWAHYITFYGWMDSTGACMSNLSYDSYGARPVIEIQKALITKE